MCMHNFGCSALKQREREEKNISYYYKRQPKRTNVEKESRELNDDVDDEKNKIVAE